MADTASISAGKELLEIALEFQVLVNKVNELTMKFSGYSKQMESGSFYDGRNRENLTLGNYAIMQHLSNLSDFYGLCFAYILNAYQSMVAMDTALAQAIVTAYVEEHNG